MPQIFWFKRCAHQHPGRCGSLSILINVGMWCERFIIIVTSLHRDFLPSSWDDYAPTWVDISLFIGHASASSRTLFLLFLKFVPAVAVTEVKELRHELAHDPTRRSAGETAADVGHGHDDAASSRDASCWRSSRRPEALLDGTTKMREAGYKDLDTHTPYPVHGLEEALGLKRPNDPAHRPGGRDRRRRASPTR